MNIIPTDHVAIMLPQAFEHKIDGRAYRLSLAAVAAEHGADHAAKVAAYLISRGLSETLNNAWSTQPADGRNHEPVAKRLARIVSDPGERGRASDEIEREAMALARKRLSAAGLKAEALKAINTPEKLRAEIERGLPAGLDLEARRALVAKAWAALMAKAEEVVRLRNEPVAPANAFADLLGDLTA